MKSGSEYFKNSTEAELMMCLNAGNREAFEEIYNRNWRPIYNSLFHVLRDNEQAGALTIKVLIAFWDNRTKHRRPKIYQNLLKELQHQLTIHFELVGNNPEKIKSIQTLAHVLLQPSKIKSDKYLRECCEIWLSTETKQRCDIFRLRYYDECTPEQIALSLNLPLQDVEIELVRISLAFEAFLKNTKP